MPDNYIFLGPNQKQGVRPPGFSWGDNLFLKGFSHNKSLSFSVHFVRLQQMLWEILKCPGERATNLQVQQQNSVCGKN